MQPYIGSGPYCYANSLAMALGPAAPSPSIIEVLTGSPFGMHLLSGQLPLFDPYGWDDHGIDDAIALLGWTCRRQSADDGEQALAMLGEAVKTGPVLAGPLEMGLLRHVPGMTGPIGSDHFVAVLEADDTRVLFHDPHGCPYATLPTRDFLAAWRADTITFYHAEPYTMRGDFQRVREVAVEAAVRACLPGAIAWLRGRDDISVPRGTVGGAPAVHRLADLVTDGLDPETRSPHAFRDPGRCSAADRRRCRARRHRPRRGHPHRYPASPVGRQPPVRPRQPARGIRSPDAAATRAHL